MRRPSGGHDPSSVGCDRDGYGPLGGGSAEARRGRDGRPAGARPGDRPGLPGGREAAERAGHAVRRPSSGHDPSSDGADRDGSGPLGGRALPAPTTDGRRGASRHRASRPSGGRDQ
ncbi:hypothetical protein Cus16_0274 [Curtobacterium sp. ER1/6]|nr:hypothetical protein Cus16_0274 [Curtobacterium sp. ER1/6]